MAESVARRYQVLRPHLSEFWASVEVMRGVDARKCLQGHLRLPGAGGDAEFTDDVVVSVAYGLTQETEL